MRKKRIVIIGAGFAGITALQKLNKSRLFDITIISPKIHFEYYPGLYRVIGDTMPFEVFVPFRYLLPYSATFLQDKVIQIESDIKKVHTDGGKICEYDILIVATGMIPSDFGIPGVSKYAHFMTSLMQARESKQSLTDQIQRHIISNTDTPFSIVLAGAGPTGVELAGELTAFIRNFARTYRVSEKLFSITIIQRDTTILPQLAPEVREKAQKRLSKLGVKILLEHTILRVNENAVMTDKEVVPFSFFFWTAGSSPSPVITQTSSFQLSQRKKVIVTNEFAAIGLDGVYVLGDNAETQYSGLAQIAEQDGAFIGNMLVARELGKSYKPYVPRKPIFVIPIGDYFGILGIYSHVFAGMLPWVLRYAVDMRFFFFRLKFKHFLSLSIERKLK
jgi:NADH dehydrogenase FAD-containing subunit